MPERRRASRRVAGILAGVVVITALGLGVKFGFLGSKRPGSGSSGPGAAAANEQSPLAVLNEGLRSGDHQILALIHKRVMPVPNSPRQALSEQEAHEWIETLAGLRTGFIRFNVPGRATAVTAACLIIDKFAVEPAPAQWALALQPVHDLLKASLADSEILPRYTALVEAGRLWVWIPGRSLTPFEEQTLGEWKAAIHMPVVRCLGCPRPSNASGGGRLPGATCPSTTRRQPRLPYVDDPSAMEVRQQALSSFSQRSALLTDEMLFKRLHDSYAIIREMASLVLKTRGLSQEQVSMGGLIYSPRPEERVSVISLLKNRTDVDPVIWLIQLSRDPVEMVRISSIEALAKHKSPTVQRRLAEMARSDGSKAVRQAVPAKVVPSAQETTVALPPLPGSSSLNPKAN